MEERGDLSSLAEAGLLDNFLCVLEEGARLTAILEPRELDDATTSVVLVIDVLLDTWPREDLSYSFAALHQ